MNIDFARSKAPWGWEALRGESEARLLDGEMGEVGPAGGAECSWVEHVERGNIIVIEAVN